MVTGLFEGEMQREASAAVLVADGDVTAVRLDQPARDRQPEPGTVPRAASRVGPVRDVEHAREIGRADAAAGVEDAYECARRVDAGFERDGAVARRVADRVLEHVAERAQHLAAGSGQLGGRAVQVTLEPDALRSGDGCR